MNIMVDNRQDKFETSEIEGLIRKVIEKTLEIECMRENFQVSVILVDDIQIQEINKEYREIDSPTDVLSFPLLEGGELEKNASSLDIDTGEIVLGDIAISLERAEEQSRDYGHSMEREISYLTVHGMLHLLGFDHEEDDDRKVMREKEESVLNFLCISR